MGLLHNPLKARGSQLPVYRKVDSPAKDHFSDDGYTSEDTDYGHHGASPSSGASRATSGSSLSSGRPMLSKPTLLSLGPRGRWPYRLPSKVTRYLVLGMIGFLILLVLSLMRASQVENWKIENGRIKLKPVAHAWEKFDYLQRYYGGIRNLTPLSESQPEYPRITPPEGQQRATEQQAQQAREDLKESSPQQKRFEFSSNGWDAFGARAAEDDFQECFLDAAGTVKVPQLQYYNGRPKGFPQSVLGSYELLDLPEDVCFERYGRWGPYGYGYSIRSGGLGTGEHGEREGSESVWESTPQVDYRNIDWADVQRRCYRANEGRFKDPPPQTPVYLGFYNDQGQGRKLVSRQEDHGNVDDALAVDSTMPKPVQMGSEFTKSINPDGQKAKEGKGRTAVVIRTWDEFIYREDDTTNLRAMISELALASGGRYDIHLLVQIKNERAQPIWADHAVYESRVRDAVPEEFRGLVTLWTETQMLATYQGMYDTFPIGKEYPIHGVYRGLSMAMQYFAYMHPEYDYFWQWEMDVRYIGHYYDFFTKVESWAKKQPRKGLWERNSRFYFPDAHGSWEDFTHLARVQSDMGTVGADNIWQGVPGLNDQSSKKTAVKSVWGPLRAPDDDDWFEPGEDPVPPHSYEQDKYEWGVGEEADYISLNPMFEPEGTTWGLKDDITGYNRSEPLPPRRAQIITTSRMSRRLLMSMHKMTAHKKQFAFPEMWPATVALQHGYKAVFAPHPIYVDRRWPVEYMASKYNAGKDGSSGGSRNAIYGNGEHNMHGLSWFYQSDFAPNLYRRWLGFNVNNDGGEQFETTEDQSKGNKDVGDMRGGEGRMCLPPMLLHPVKDVELPVEAPPPEEVEGFAQPIGDPAA